MKKLTLLLLMLLPFITFAQQWTGISSDEPSTLTTSLVSSSESMVRVHLQVPGFYTLEVNTPRGNAQIISVPKAVSTSEAGEPCLPMIAIPAIVGDQQHYSIKVVDANYLDYGMEVAPSKGDFSRQIDPADVPYTYGPAYSTDAFFPAEQVGLYEPYILRDFRGQNMVIHPFAYNPVTKTLRVYYDMTIEMYSDGQPGENTLNRKSNAMKMDPEIKALYENHFINYTAATAKYTPVDETGELLIICHDAFMSAMEPFVNWKRQIGRPTTMVGTSTAGATSEAIKAYVQAQYNANNNISHILLVGDNAQIQGYYAYNGGYSGRSDNWYGQVAGNDFYNDVIVGRFSAESLDHVTTQVNKVIHYERDINATDTWLSTGTGVATVAGSGGHFGEDDWQHIDNIRNDLLAYNYTEVYRDYPSGGGASSNSATLSSHINAGVSIINYCNHGSETSWGVFNYSNSNVNALTNVNKLPFIWSVACLNGKYDHYQPCFAEAWLRATNGNDVQQPTGAIGGMFSYISQPWVPPMYGQDEMVDVLIESHSNNIKRTLGGISFDGNMKIIDQYGTNNASGMGTYMCWILFGDPTLTVRTAIPTNMNVTHAPTLGTNNTTFTVNAPNGNGAVATLSRDNQIMGSATITNGSCNISFAAPGTPGQATLTVFGYNKITYVATINITSGGTNPITLNVMANPQVIAQGQSTQLNANATGGNGSFTYSWSPATSLSNPSIANPIANPTTTTNYTCTVSSNGQSQTSGCKVTVVCPPTNLTANVNGQNVQLQWTAPTDAESYNVYRNGSLLTQGVNGTAYTDRNVPNGTYTYYLVTNYAGVTSPNSSSVSATVNATISVNATASPTLIAQGGSSTLNAMVTGGTGVATYSWTPAGSLDNPNSMTPVATPTETTTYTVTVTRGGLTATAQVTVQVVTPPTEIQVTQRIDVQDQVLIVWTAPALASTYNVYDNGTMIQSGITLTQTEVSSLDNGTHCFTVSAVYQNVESPESEEACVEIFVCRPPTDFEAYYVWENSVFGTQLRWEAPTQTQGYLTQYAVYRGTDMTAIECIAYVENDPQASEYEYFDVLEAAGEFFYYVMADYGDHGQCLTEAMLVNITAVDEASSTLRLYPNPTHGEVVIEGAVTGEVQVINALGQVVYSTAMEGEQTVLDLSHLVKGLYWVTTIDRDGRRQGVKVLLQ